MRLTASVDEALMALCVGAWCNWLAEYKKNKEFEDHVKASEKKVKETLLQYQVELFEPLFFLELSKALGLYKLGA